MIIHRMRRGAASIHPFSRHDVGVFTTIRFWCVETGVIQWDLFWGESNHGKFCGISLFFVHCLDGENNNPS